MNTATGVLDCGGRPLGLDRPRIMGIVNINDDSFSGDGTLDVAEAGRLAEQMISEGAVLI